MSTIVYLYALLSEKGEVTRGRFLLKPKRSRYAARLVMKTSVRWKRAVDENTKVFMINIDKWKANGFNHDMCPFRSWI